MLLVLSKSPISICVCITKQTCIHPHGMLPKRHSTIFLEKSKVRRLRDTRWNGRRGYLRRWKWRGDQRVVSGTGECTREEIGSPSMLRVIHRGCVLCEDVSDLRFEMGVVYYNGYSER